MAKLEILAPAGSMESLVAGVRCGANAVYLGGKLFNARKNAGNFDDDELAQAIQYCHCRNVKVYLTLNTLLSDNEILSALSYVEMTANLGVDGYIVQDLGLTYLIKTMFPQIHIHASTQMSVMSPMGFKLLKDLGFVRGVLPRELSKNEINEIHNATDIDLECFVHGALCMCVSGQCYLSGMLGSRSGNRGLCAQPCRLPFAVMNKGDCDLSLKDLSLVENIAELSEVGVTSLKIEGRMKRSEYVAAAVTACKKSINDDYSNELRQDLKDIFSRSGFTDGYFKGKLGLTMFGTRQKEDVVSAKPILNKLSQLYKNENPLIPVDFALTILKDEPISISAKSLGKTVFIESDIIAEKAINKPMTVESLTQRISKCGGTQFYVNNVDVELDEGLIVSASELNALRREAISKLENAFIHNNLQIEHKEIDKLEFENRIFNGFVGRFKKYSQIPENADKLIEISLPLEESKENFQLAMGKFANVCVEIPRGLFGNEHIVEKKLLQLKEIGINSCICSNLGAVAICKKLNLEVIGGFGLNIFNSFSLKQLDNLGINRAIMSFELTNQQLNNIKSNIDLGIIGYGRVPLMLTRNCAIKNKIGCEKCNKNGKITDRKDIEFPVQCTYGTSEILNSQPIYLADRLTEFKNINFMTLYFTVESADECEKIIDNYFNKSAPKIDYTRGLYYRGVL